MTATADTAPPLSVVMPTLNQAAYIRLAVASVLTQGIPDLELVVQDGGSTDGTQDILAELAARHPCIRWVSEPDHGPAEALNRAFARARGAVVGWLNSDDLYTPGAAARALAALERHPDHVMVYGNGEHIDDAGALIAPYPAREPAAALATAADGCHICQPTAFFRLSVLQALGGLDTTLRTAFDYDFWLRLLKAYPGRVGFVPEVQAQTRLHADAITLRLREQVALEAVQVIRRHIGPAPAHWLLTHFDELMRELPSGGTEAPNLHMLRLVERAAPALSAEAVATLRRFVAGHAALRLAGPRVFADVHGDGWAGAEMALRVRGASPLRLLLRGVHAGPQVGPLRLTLHGPQGVSFRFQVDRRGPFRWALELPPAPDAGTHTWTLQCAPAFVPARVERGSRDERALAFQLTALECPP